MTAAVPEQELRARVAKLTPEQKVRLLTGSTFWTVDAEPAAGLRRFVVSDGPVGARGETWDDRDPSANIPSPTAVAAAWDVDLAERLGALLAAECRRKGVDVLLAPTVNLHRTPLGGRHFECFSEDPVLTGLVAAGLVRGLQDHGVGACVKHFVANDAETDRMTVDNRVDERTLHDLYLEPFRIIEEDARPWSYMAAYNAVNGPTMTENPLVADVLKGDWGSDALVMSDWFATRSTVPAALSGLDLVMPGPYGPWGDALLAAVRSGEVPQDVVDEKVLRLLRLAARTGALEGVDGAGAPPPPVDDAAVTALTREAAAAGSVLVRNDGVLPWAAAPRTVAVIGPNAARGRTLGGGSATVFPASVVHPLAGIAAALPGAQVRHALGVSATDRVPPFEGGALQLPDGSGPGVELAFHGADGTELGRETRRQGAFTWMGDVQDGVPAADVAEVVVRARLVAAGPGAHRVGLSGVGSGAVVVDGVERAAGELALRPGADVVEGIMTPPQLVAEVDLAEGAVADVELRFRRGAGLPMLVLQVNVAPPRGTDDEEIAAAVALARDSDAVVVVVGTTEEVESEGYDRTDLRLPGRQDELVEAVLAANPDAVVVVNSGAPVLMPWLDRARAVLLVWFPGQEMGSALADVLTGAAEPGGRMPTSWPAADHVVAPQNVPVDGVVEYAEGLDIGYRAYLRDGVVPAVPFGHGLGYTTWELGTPRLEDGAVVVPVRNTGGRDGAHVVQAYLSRPGSAVPRPDRWLAGFAKVRLAAGEGTEVRIDLPDRVFAHHEAGRGRVVEPGTFVLAVGSSVVDLPHRLDVAR